MLFAAASRKSNTILLERKLHVCLVTDKLPQQQNKFMRPLNIMFVYLAPQE